MAKYRAAVVSAHGTVTGVVGEDIGVFPSMSPKYHLDFLACRAAVAEVGGELAHLAIVSRETGRTLMILRGACKMLRPGMRVTLDPSRCEIRTEE